MPFVITYSVITVTPLTVTGIATIHDWITYYAVTVARELGTLTFLADNSHLVTRREQRYIMHVPT